MYFYRELRLHSFIKLLIVRLSLADPFQICHSVSEYKLASLIFREMVELVDDLSDTEPGVLVFSGLSNCRAVNLFLKA